eukprot:scaffold13293_cov72-Skeletonema_dohrnii-CCMP3373.AAC.1
MVLESRAGSWRPSDASSGHLRRYSDADTTNKCLSRGKDASILSWPTLMESRAGSWRPSQMPHQVTYDVIATPIRPTNA